MVPSSDLVFLDNGVENYANVLTALWSEDALRKGAILIADNMAKFGNRNVAGDYKSLLEKAKAFETKKVPIQKPYADELYVSTFQGVPWPEGRGHGEL